MNPITHLLIGWEQLMPVYQQMYRDFDWAGVKRLVNDRP